MTAQHNQRRNWFGIAVRLACGGSRRFNRWVVAALGLAMVVGPVPVVLGKAGPGTPDTPPEPPEECPVDGGSGGGGGAGGQKPGNGGGGPPKPCIGDGKSCAPWSPLSPNYNPPPKPPKPNNFVGSAPATTTGWTTTISGPGWSQSQSVFYSTSPVRYFDGAVDLSVTDVASPRGGMLVHTRKFFNQANDEYGGPNGYNWFVNSLPYVVEIVSGEATINVVIDPNNPYYFDFDVDAGYVARHGVVGAKLVLVDDPDDPGTKKQFVFTRGSGGRSETYVFHDFNQYSYDGRLKSHTDAGGVTTTVTAYVDNRPATLQRSYTETIGGTATTVLEALVYSYYLYGYDTHRIYTATLRRKVGTGNWADVRRALYTYYDGTEANGNKNDLKQVLIQEPAATPGEFDTVQASHYRYYVPSEANGYVRGLKYAVEAEGYRRMLNATPSLNPLTATDAQLAPYAEHYFKYDSTTRRVTQEVAAAGCASCSGGGSGTTGDVFTSTTATHGQGDGYNKWKTKTTLTHPDGNKTITYTNYVGQVMLKVFEETTGTRRWGTFFKYDTDGRPILKAEPSAVSLPANLSTIEAYADLLHADGGNYEYLADGTGLVHVTDYYATTDAGTGAVKGLTSYEKVKNGETGTAIKLSKLEYATQTAGGVTVNPVSKLVTYPDASNDTVTITTTYAYEWHTGTTVMKQRTTTLPAVATGQNGSNGTDTTVEVFDTAGRPTWTKDARGFITRAVYTGSIGLLAQVIQDVNTDTTDDEPTGWVSPSPLSERLHLVTDYEYDAEGRLVQTLGPSHTAVVSGAATTVRAATWTVYNETPKPASGTWAEDETWSGSGYATGTAGNYTYALVNPVQLAKQDKKGRTVHSIESKRSSGSGKLSASDTFAQGDWKRWTKQNYLDNGRLCCVRRYHTIPASGEGAEGTNYDERHFGYDAMGRPDKVKSAGGTITRTVYDARGLVSSTWVGLDDTPDGGGTWSPTNTTGTDLVKVAENEYDGGNAGGGGNLTKVTQYAGASDTRVTNFGYDWRDRQTSMDGEVDAYAAYTYDNLDRLTRVDHHNTTSAGNLIGRGDTKYDDRSRVYQRITYAVDPANGNVGNSLTSNNWYDPDGNLIKSVAAGSGKIFTKNVYDGLGRMAKIYIGYDTDETAYGDADDVSGDTILEQVETSYDEAGNVTLATSRQRLHDATGEGELTTISGSQPKARVSYAATWYDGVGRSIGSANYGTNADASLTRPGTVPARSDTVLVTTTEYNDAGEAFKRLDPKAIESRTTFDHAGRVMQTVEAYDDGDPATGNADRDRTTLYAYNPDGKVKTLTAKNASTGDQVTTYVYGTTTTESGVAMSNLLRATIYPDSDDVASPLGNGTDNTYDRVELKYNRLAEITEQKDQNGTVRMVDYDKLGRATHDRATTLGGSTSTAVKRISRTYEVRGMVEKVTSYNNATVGSGTVVNEVQFAYNTFGQLATEYQDVDSAVDTTAGTGSPRVVYTYADGAGGSNHVRLTSMTYPNGRVITYDRGTSGGMDDVLGRVAAIKDGATSLAAYTYLGGAMPVRIDHAQPQVRLDLIGAGNYAGLDRFGRVIDQQWVNTSTSTDLDRWKYGYDRNSSRTYKENTVSTSRSELYAYDNLDRLTSFDRGTLNGTKDGLTGMASRSQDWTLDPLGNWNTLTTDGTGVNRTHDKANQLTAVGATNKTYDANGNLTASDLGGPMTYDAWNRVIRVGANGVPLVREYRYDGLGRRVRDTGPGLGGAWRDQYHSRDWQVIEERSGSSVTVQYVWGLRYVDEMVCRDRDTDADGAPDDERLYPLQDANFNVTALVDTSGAVVERFAYDPYGTPSVLDANWAADADGNSDVSWIYLHQGGRYEPSTLLYHFRNRDHSHTLGRWGQRDPLGYIDGINVYQYVRSIPPSIVDPYGLYYSDKISKWGKTKCACMCGVVGCETAAKLGAQALKETQDRFPGSTLHNDAADAWRHCYWNCLMARATNNLIGDCPKYIADLYEAEGAMNGQPAEEQAMDEHNNHWGRELAKQSGNCADLCQGALDAGNLFVLVP